MLHPCRDPDCTFSHTVSRVINVPGYCDVQVDYDLWICSPNEFHTTYHFVNFTWSLTYPSCDSLKTIWDTYVTSSGGNTSVILGLDYHLFENALRQTLSDIEIIPTVVLGFPETLCGTFNRLNYTAQWFTASCQQLCYIEIFGWGWHNVFECGTTCCLAKYKYCIDPITNLVRRYYEVVKIGNDVCLPANNVECSNIVVDCHDTCDETIP